MEDSAYNLFLYVEGAFIKALGVAVHELEGTDQDKLSALQRLVDSDYKIATRYDLESPLKWNTYESLMRLGRELEIFEQIFRDLKAPLNPLVVITPIVDNAPRILAVTRVGALDLDDLKGTPLGQSGVMVDYLKKYVKDDHFDLPQLMNDDFFLAIKLLYNAGHYVSAAKLLMSFVDTVAFVDAGDVKNNFVIWLDAYADVASLGITSKELWEFRNGLLHMSNLRSRAVASGAVVPLILYVGDAARRLPPSQSGAKYVGLKALIDAIAMGVSRWIETYNSLPDKWVDFVTRYDLTISDSRMAYMGQNDPAEQSAL